MVILERSPKEKMVMTHDKTVFAGKPEPVNSFYFEDQIDDETTSFDVHVYVNDRELLIDNSRFDFINDLLIEGKIEVFGLTL